MVGECSGKILSMPTPKLTRRTVNVALDARPFFEITTPSNACRRSFSFSPSPSFRRTFTRTLSPGRNSGKSLRSCASCNFRIIGFIVVSLQTRSGGASTPRPIRNYSQSPTHHATHFAVQSRRIPRMSSCHGCETMGLRLNGYDKGQAVTNGTTAPRRAFPATCAWYIDPRHNPRRLTAWNKNDIYRGHYKLWRVAIQACRDNDKFRLRLRAPVKASPPKGEFRSIAFTFHYIVTHMPFAV